VITVVLLAGLVAALSVRNPVNAAVTVAEALGVSVPRPFAPDATPETAEVSGVLGRIYDVAKAPAILIVPGATPDGVEDTRVNQVAAALARAGRIVFIPELDLYSEEFTEADLERIVSSVEGLHARTGRPVTVVGFSFGGSFALVASAEERIEGKLSRIATFGAYYRLEGLIPAITTGVSVVDGRVIPWDGHPLAGDVLIARTVEQLPIDLQDPVLAALDGRVVDPDELAAEGRALYDLLANDDPEHTDQLADRLTGRTRALLDGFSPDRVVHLIDAPVLAMHSTDDPLVPHAELLRVESEMPGVETTTVGVFSHVDFNEASVSELWGMAGDLMRVWRFTAWVLAG
jgi:pimeloyl-ACP methyl ester carboxylesterase